MIYDRGQKTKETFVVVNTGTAKGLSIEDCPKSINDCNYINIVMANDSGNLLENDRTPILRMFPDWTTSAVFVLQKKVAGEFVDQVTIVDNTYGQWFPQGSFASKPKYAGFIIFWAQVKTGFGIGEYRLKITEVNPLALGGVDDFSIEFCLKEFTCTSAENTTRVEWTNNGKIGSIDKDEDILDFADLNWPSQFRIPNSIFGYPTSEYEIEENQHTNGEFEQVVNKQTETYEWTIGLLPSFMHDILKTYGLMSGSMVITDYSSNNPATIIEKAVKPKSGWEPRWSKTNKCAPIRVELEPRINNLEIDRC